MSKALYWLAKEEIASTKVTSLLELIEKMGVDDLKYFQTRSELVLRKMLLLIAKAIIQDIVVKIKRSNVYGLLTGEVTDKSNICQLVLFVKYYDYNKEIDCLNLLEFFKSSPPNADTIVFCVTEKFQELQIKISNSKVFVSDGTSVMIGRKSGVATKLETNFALKMFNIICICHRLALACADTGDDYKFIRNVGEILIEL